jgi:hypothetical protein
MYEACWRFLWLWHVEYLMLSPLKPHSARKEMIAKQELSVEMVHLESRLEAHELAAAS